MTGSGRRSGVRFGAWWPLLALPILAAAVAWALWPLRAAGALPNPPWPVVDPEPPDRQEALLFAPTTLVPDARGVQVAPRVVIYDPGRALPLAGVPVRLSLARRDDPAHTPLASAAATTDDQGTAAPLLSIPGPHLAPLEGGQPLVLLLTVEVDGPLGSQRLVHRVTVEPDVRLALLTDRSRYQPGQTIHLLAHVHSALPLPDGGVTLTVAGAQGTVLCQEHVRLSPAGLASADCALAGQAGPGVYRLSATLSTGLTANAEIDVEPAAAAQALLALDASAPYHTPASPVRLSLRAAQPWGTPLAAAPLTVTVSLHGTPPRPLARLAGSTDERGEFILSLPGDLLPADVRPGEAQLLHLEAEVRGPSGTARAWRTLPAAAQPILLQLAAESGALVPGLENQLSAQAHYPDGRPAQVTLHAGAPGLEAPLVLQTDAQGRVSWPYRPQAGQAVPWTLVARDAEGRAAETTIELPIAPGPAYLLLRPGRARAAPGETLHLDAWYLDPTDGPERGLPVLYVDLQQNDRSVGGTATPLNGGHAAFDLPLPTDLAWGTLELRAYAAPSNAQAASAWAVDTRRVQILPASAAAPPPAAGALQVQLDAGGATYAPGETAQLSARVLDAAQRGQPGALTVALVAAGAGPAHPPLASVPPEPAQELAYLRSGTLSAPRPLPSGTEARFQAVAQVRAARQTALGRPALRIARASLALLGLAWIAALASTWRDRRLAQQGQAWVARLLGGLLLLALAAPAAALLADGSAALFGPGAAIVLGLAWLGALLALGVSVLQARCAWGQILWATTGASLALALALGHARRQGAPLAPAWIAAALGSGLGLALALYLYGVGRARRGARPLAAAAWATAGVLLVTLSNLARVPAAPSAHPSAAEALTALLAERRPAPHPTAARSQRGTLPVPVPDGLPARAAPLLPQAAALETAYWLPEARTTMYGERSIPVPLPDTGDGDWRVAVLAWDPGGATGQAEIDLSISRPLWLDAPLPGALTVGDELDLPLAVYNPLPITQTVQITVSQAAWYSVRGSHAQSLTLPAHAVGRAVLPLTVRAPGPQRLEVVAQSEHGRAVWARAVDVTPNGGRVWRIFDGAFPATEPSRPASSSLPAPQEPVTAPLPTDRWRFRLPWLALPGTERVTVTLHTGPSSVLAEGLAAVSLPDRTVALDQLAAATRSLALQAPSAADVAGLYPRFLSYEAPEGGFGLWPGEPPTLYASAEALSALAALARLTFVDPALLERTAAWLLARQAEPGTWSADVPPGWQRLPRLELPVTAHVAARLIEAGYGTVPELRRAAEHLARYPDKAGEPYVLALVAHALVVYDEAAADQTDRLAPPVLDRLAGLAQPEGDGAGAQAAWRGEIETWSGAAGTAADVETTALAATALLRAAARPELAAQALAWLAQQRDARGCWGSAHTHELALRAFQAAAAAQQAAAQQAPPSGADAGHGTAQVYVSVDGIAAPPQTLGSSPKPERVPLSFDTLSKGYNEIVLSRSGLGDVRYRIVGTYLLPWSELPTASPDEPVPFDLAYDRTSVAVGASITATVTITPPRTSTAAGIVLELGLPPGLAVDEQAWQALLDDGTIDRWQRDGQAMIVHLLALPAQGPLRFSYRLQACFPLSVWTPPSRAYPAGDPLRPAVRAPVRIQAAD